MGEARKSGTARFPLPTLLLLGTLMFVGHSRSRNLFNGMLRDSGALGRTLADILGSGPPALPHLDTLEKALRGVDPADLERVLARCVSRLIRMKALDGWRSGGRFLLAVDGTGLWSFRERHCPHCVRTQHASGAGDRQAVDWLRSGVIGKVRRIVLCANRPGAEKYRLARGQK